MTTRKNRKKKETGPISDSVTASNEIDMVPKETEVIPENDGEHAAAGVSSLPDPEVTETGNEARDLPEESIVSWPGPETRTTSSASTTTFTSVKIGDKLYSVKIEADPDEPGECLCGGNCETTLLQATVYADAYQTLIAALRKAPRPEDPIQFGKSGGHEGFMRDYQRWYDLHIKGLL